MIDVEVARTFLAIVETGTFQGAANKVNVTQSTVSARVKTLEERLGQRMFARSKSGAQLTSHGFHFERYARAIVRAWEQGKQQVGIPETFEDMLIIGGQYNLWARFLTQWLISMQDEMPGVAFRAEAGTPEALSRLLSEGLLDIAVLHQPRLRTDISVEHLMDDELLLVTTDPNGKFEDRYTYIDWGEEYRDCHAQLLPHLMEPRTSVSLGFFGPSYLIASNAAGYVPRRLVEPHLAGGYLHRTTAPSIDYPVFVAYQSEGATRAQADAITLLRKKAELCAAGNLPAPFWSEAE
ncbi:MAG: LysR family transcriptional regulator [Henriciella sp.]